MSVTAVREARTSSELVRSSVMMRTFDSGDPVGPGVVGVVLLRRLEERRERADEGWPPVELTDAP